MLGPQRWEFVAELVGAKRVLRRQALQETIPEDCYEFVGFSQMEAAMRITKTPS